jgi:hypothetical protein
MFREMVGQVRAIAAIVNHRSVEPNHAQTGK